MSVEQVRLLTDIKTMAYDTVPIDQLPTGVMLCRFLNHGEIYAPSHMLKATGRRHSPFPPAARDELRRFARVFHDVYPITLDRWEDGFRGDTHPWREMATWDVIAATFEKFAAKLGRHSTATKRQNIYAVVLELVNTGGRCAAIRHGYKTVPPAVVKQMKAHLDSEAMHSLRKASIAKYREMLPEQVAAVSFPAQVTIDALCDENGRPNTAAPFDVHEILDGAGVILAHDIDTDTRRLVFGRDQLERVVGTGESEAARTLTVSIDYETDELERLIGLVQAIKGKHDYRAS